MPKITELIRDCLREVRCINCKENKALAEIRVITIINEDKEPYSDDLTDEDIEYTCKECMNKNG